MKAFLDPVGWMWMALVAVSVRLLLTRRRRAGWVCAALAVGWWAIEFWAVPTRLLAGLENEVAAGKGPWDAVVVLGGGWSPTGRPPLALEANDAFDRLLAGVEAVRSGRANELWLGGGTGRAGGPTDGEAARDWVAHWHLVAPDKVVVLPASKNTRDEAVHAAEQAMAGGATMRVGVVTSAWHMGRAIQQFERAGLAAEGVPCDFPAAASLEYREKAGPNWWPRQGSLQHLYLWLCEVVGKLK